MQPAVQVTEAIAVHSQQAWRPTSRALLPSVRPRRAWVGTMLKVLLVATQPAWAGPSCDAPAGTWQPRSAVNALAERNGWRVDRLKVDDGCYEIRARDAQGRHIQVLLDPATLQVIRIKRGREGHDDDHEHDHTRDPTAGPPA